MTRDEVIRMAKEVSLNFAMRSYEEDLQKFAALVAAAEREACAKACDAVECGSAMMIEERHTAAQCARKIRARGEV